MSSDLPPSHQSRPSSAPSSDRNRTRDRNAMNACDEAVQTDLLPLTQTSDVATITDPDSHPAPMPTTSTSPSSNVSNLNSDDAIRVRSNLATSITAPILKQTHVQ